MSIHRIENGATQLAGPSMDMHQTLAATFGLTRLTGRIDSVRVDMSAEILVLDSIEGDARNVDGKSRGPESRRPIRVANKHLSSRRDGDPVELAIVR